MFAAPTSFYKTGVAFLSWLNGHQPAFSMVGGLHSGRSLPHLSTLVRLADQAAASRSSRPCRAAMERLPHATRSRDHHAGARMIAHPRLSLNQATIRYADLPTALHITRETGIDCIGLWREPVAASALDRRCDGDRLRTARLKSVSRRLFHCCRPRLRRAALDDNRRAIAETAALAPAGADGSAPVLVLVAGGLPDSDRDLPGARTRAQEAVAALVDDAAAAGVRLAIEPMHPIYAADRGVISTLAQALDIAEQFPSDVVGVLIDTFHVWWDPELPEQIHRAGKAGIAGTRSTTGSPRYHPIRYSPAA